MAWRRHFYYHWLRKVKKSYKKSRDPLGGLIVSAKILDENKKRKLNILPVIGRGYWCIKDVSIEKSRRVSGLKLSESSPVQSSPVQSSPVQSSPVQSSQSVSQSVRMRDIQIRRRVRSQIHMFAKIFVKRPVWIRISSMSICGFANGGIGNILEKKKIWIVMAWKGDEMSKTTLRPTCRGCLGEDLSQALSFCVWGYEGKKRRKNREKKREKRGRVGWAGVGCRVPAPYLST